MITTWLVTILSVVLVVALPRISFVVFLNLALDVFF